MMGKKVNGCMDYMPSGRQTPQGFVGQEAVPVTGGTPKREKFTPDFGGDSKIRRGGCE